MPKKDFSKEPTHSTGNFTFLNIDVYESKQLKEKETQADITHSFEEFHSLVNKYVEDNKYLRDSEWAGDGLIAAFEKPEEAISVAKNIQKTIPDFNANKKSIKRSFALRIGINTSSIFYNPRQGIGEWSDESIDLAGHLQKECPPGQILISEDTYNKLSDEKKSDFKKFKNVNEKQVYCCNTFYSEDFFNFPSKRVEAKGMEYTRKTKKENYRLDKISIIKIGILIIVFAILAVLGFILIYSIQTKNEYTKKYFEPNIILIGLEAQSPFQGDKIVMRYTVRNVSMADCQVRLRNIFDEPKDLDEAYAIRISNYLKQNPEQSFDIAPQGEINNNFELLVKNKKKSESFLIAVDAETDEGKKLILSWFKWPGTTANKSIPDLIMQKSFKDF